MTNEIKEILDRFYDEYPKEIKILENYITNLQKRNKELEEGFKASTEELCEYATKCEELQQKIDKAVEYIDNCFVGEEVPRGDDYVFNEYYYYDPLKREEAIELLDILRGDE